MKIVCVLFFICLKYNALINHLYLQTIVCSFAFMERKETAHKTEKKKVAEEAAKIFGAKIQRIRKSNGLSLMQLANIVDVSDTALSKIETGKTTSITVDLGKKLSSALNISFNELFEIEAAENLNINELKKEIEEIKNLNKSQQDFINNQSQTLGALLDVNKFYQGELEKLEGVATLLKNFIDNLPEGISFQDALSILNERTDIIKKL